MGDLKKLPKVPNGLECDVEGRLLMVDLGNDPAKFDIHPIVGQPIRCTFDGNSKEYLANYLTEFVRVKGTPKRDLESGEIESVTVRQIQALSKLRSERNQTVLGKLIEEQGLKSQNLDDLLRICGNDDDDGFIDAIEEIRSGS